jgi:phosphoglycolate phosphatase
LKKYKSIIWDWNGTLLNDVTLCLKIVNDILKSQKLKTLERDEYLNVFGFPISNYYKKIGVDFSKVTYDELTKIFIGKYNEAVHKCHLQDDVKDALTHFQSQGKRQFILTAAHKKSVNTLLDHYSIDSFFHHVEGLDNYRGDSKVDKGKKLIQSRGIAPHDAVLIGDTDHDFEVAQHLNIDCILIAQGHQSKSRLQELAGERCLVVNSIDSLSQTNII